VQQPVLHDIFVMTNASNPFARKARPGPPADMHEAICRRAEEIYVRKGRIPGHDLENWMQAEAEILRESVQVASRRNAIVVKVEGVQYVGEYDASAAGGYAPGELAAGEAVTVRFDGDKMFVQRDDHTELETTIVKRLSQR
jgi:hypothetical protein